MIRFRIVDKQKYVTVGYWHFTKSNNEGDLIIELSKLSDWRFTLAVAGHELIESVFCWIFHITTEECDKFDDYYEALYKSGEMNPEMEAGHDPKCPYHWGHMAGVVWEYIAIYGTFASWKKYYDDCMKVMEIE